MPTVDVPTTAPFLPKKPEQEDANELLPKEAAGKRASSWADKFHSRIPKPSRLWTACYISRRIIITLLAIRGLLSSFYQLSHGMFRRVPNHSCSCGNSTTEARALGCRYDSAALAWLSAHCRDDPLLNVEIRYSEKDHIDHCWSVIMMRMPLDDINTIAGVALTSDESE